MPYLANPSPKPAKAGIQIAIDRGGTFTDCIGTNIPGKETIVVKLLSVDPSNYDDAPTAGTPFQHVCPPLIERRKVSGGS